MKVSQVGCFQITSPLNMLFHFPRYLIYSVFHETIVKTFMKNLSFFSSNVKNPFKDVVYYWKLRCLTLWYWNVGPLNIRFVHFGAVFSEIKNIDILNFHKWNISAMIYHITTWMGLLLLKLRAVEFESRTESRLLIARQIASSQVTPFWCF